MPTVTADDACAKQAVTEHTGHEAGLPLPLGGG